MANNKITRDSILEEKVLKIGTDYAKSLDPAIKANKKWVDSFAPIKAAALEYAGIEKNFKVSKSRSEFLKIAKLEEELRRKTAEAVKAEQNALSSLEGLKKQYLNTEKASLSVEKEKESAKQASLRTSKLELDIEAKKQRSQRRTIKLTEEEKLEQRLLARGRREAAVISSKLSTEYEKQSVILTKLRREYKDLALKEGESSKRAKELQQQIHKLDATLKRVDANVGQFQRSVGNYSKAMNSARNAARSLASAMGLVGGAFLIVQVVRDATKVVRDFEKQNATLSAILQVEKKDMRELTDDSQRLGETTVKTAGQVTGLQIAYARLGFTQNEILDLTEATIAGSIAMNAELDRTANLTGAVVNTFDDLSTTDAPKILDILALSTAKSALNFQKLEVGIPIVAGAANAAGVPFTKLVALMGKLADSGIDVSTSSTAIRNIFIESKAQGLDYGQILEKIKNSQDKLTASNDEFGKRAAVSAAVLANNIDKTNELDEALNNAAGTAQRMADKELDTLDGSLKLIRSAFEGYILSLNDSTGAGEKLRDGIRFIAENFSTLVSSLVTAGKVWIAYKTFVFLARIQQSLMNKTMVLTRLAAIRSAGGVKIATLSWKAFNTVLKANAIGIAIAALYAIYEIVQRLNVPLSEMVEKTNESTEAFLNSTFSMEAHSNSMAKAAERYDELTAKTSLNEKEQRELDDIIKQIAKDVPLAVTEVDKYGNALSINTGKVKEFNDENARINGQLEKTLLKENEEQLKLLEKAQSELNRVTEEGVAFYVEGVGRVANYNGVLKKQEIQGRKNVDVIVEGNALTSTQIQLVQDAIKQNEKDIAQKKLFIQSLTAEGREMIRLNEEKERQREIDEKLADESKVIAEGKAEELLKVQELQEKIKSLNLEKKQLNRNQIDERIAKDKLIAIYQKEIDLILGTAKATKSSNKAEKERLALAKQLSSDIIKLEQFSLKKRIEYLDSVANEEDAAYEVRKQAIFFQNNLEIELERSKTQVKLDAINYATDQELAVIAKGGERSIALKEEIAEREKNARLLIEEEFIKKRDEIKEKNENRTDAIDIEKFQNDAKLKADIQQKLLNEELERENDFFASSLDQYNTREDAIEASERRIAEIKKRYAIDALNVQVAAIDKLLKDETLSAEKRAALEAELSGIKLQISDLNTQQYLENNEKEVISEEEKVEQILAISQALASALVDLANSIFEARIQSIDEEIDANDDRTERLLENENLSDEQRAEIEAKGEERREQLEEKKRKEQRKQAILNKSLAVVDVAIATALGIMQSYAQLGPIAGNVGAALVGALGAIQIAAIIAKPIPAYAKGTDNHKGGPALVGEERPEVIQEPNRKPYVVSKPTILDLPRKTKVTPSVAEYDKMMRDSVLTDIHYSNNKMNSFQASQLFDQSGKNIVAELKETRRAIERNKPKDPKDHKPVDLNHELFRFKNTKWS